jgi:hypothetical protein
MPLMPRVYTIGKGLDETVTIPVSPPQSIDGWTLEFRAKATAVNPDSTTSTVLYEDIDDETTAVTVARAVGFPYEGEFKIRIDNEVMQVTTGPALYADGRLNVQWVVERGVHGTTAAEHTARARVTLFSQPQMLLDNGDNGGVTVEDADVGVVSLRFDAAMTAERPAGTYFWTLRRTNAGFSQLVANGVLYLTPSPLSGLLEPPVHS